MTLRKDIPGGRTGRRPGASTTRGEILTAARASFAELGYDRTTMRGVAGRAGVDPALVHRFFGSKDELLTAALAVAANPAGRIPEVMEGDPTRLGERVVRYFLSVWDRPSSGEVMIGMLRSAATNERAAKLMRDFLSEEILSRIAAPLDEKGRLRATLMSSQLLGLATLRYILRVEPLASASTDTIVAALAPTIQHYLAEDLALEEA
jgi:AcrR family transcriptional regulator